ncbi:MAG: phospholipid carrier-dependent glycosyltransferase, partial [Gemmatimonadetes bacterium]
MPPESRRDPSSRRPRYAALALAAGWALLALYAWVRLDRGWVPHDEGTLSLSAWRVLDGALPHRDYAEVYTGGLAYLDAGAFRLLGERLIVLRWVLFAVYVAWIPVLYAVLRRFATAPLAALGAALGALWSVPSYSAAMPSWYNLFLATAALWALLRAIEVGGHPAGGGTATGPRSPQGSAPPVAPHPGHPPGSTALRHRRWWLFAAGVFSGLSILVKIVGLYLVAGVGLALAFHVTLRPDAAPRAAGAGVGGPAAPAAAPVGGRLWAGLLTLGALLLTVLLVRLVAPLASARVYAHFVAPGAAVAALLAWTAWRTRAAAVGEGARPLRAGLALAAPYALGLALPLAVFLAPYLAAGALGALRDGLFVAPFDRLTSARMRPPLLRLAWPAVLAVAAAGLWPHLPRRWRWVVGVSAGGTALWALARAGADWPTYQRVWNSMRWLPP